MQGYYTTESPATRSPEVTVSSKPTLSPSVSPVAASPSSTTSPMTNSPSISPSSPTSSPNTYQPTGHPASMHPSSFSPSTNQPSAHPMSIHPISLAPATIHPTSGHPTSTTVSPSTRAPMSNTPSTCGPVTICPSTSTCGPVTICPSTGGPASLSPSSNPSSNSPSSKNPISYHPSTSPSANPTTSCPSTVNPFTNNPTVGPNSCHPATLAPSIKPPSESPATCMPSTPGPVSLHPGSQAPSNGPTSNSPTTNSPRTNSPRTNSPRTYSPSTNSPRTNSPSTNSPRTNSPSNSPRTNSPSTNSPSTNSPSTNSPRTNSPSTNSPRTNNPSNSPRTNSPSTNSPRTNTPSTNSPRTNNPSNSPRTNSPRTNSPSTNSPRTNSPRTNSPRTNSPSSKDPTTCTPSMTPTSFHPASIQPTCNPTSAGPSTQMPSSQSPSGSPSITPATLNPASAHPGSTRPTVGPTVSPTVNPTTVQPSYSSSSSPSTPSPASLHAGSSSPSNSPTSVSPLTYGPSSASPSSICPLMLPTRSPTSGYPTACPSQCPSKSPLTHQPTFKGQGTRFPTSSPTLCVMTVDLNEESAVVNQPKAITPNIDSSNCFVTTVYVWKVQDASKNTVATGSNNPLYIPANTLLPLGVYTISLDILIPGKVFTAQNTLTVQSQQLIAKIDGGSSKTVQALEAFALTTSSKNDPDNVAKAANSAFEWTCATSTAAATCPDLRGRADDTLSISANEMGTVGEYTFTFNWTVTYGRTSRTGLAQMVVTLAANPVPDVDLSGPSTVNEGQDYRITSTVSPSSTFSRLQKRDLAVLSSSTSGVQYTYIWTADSSLNFLTTTSGPDFACSGLLGGQTYTFRLDVSAPSTGTATTMLRVTVNQAPECSGIQVSPNTGIALQTDFTFNMNGCTDPDDPSGSMPLIYEMWVDGSLLVNDLSSSTYVTNAIPAGDAVVVSGYALDSLGAKSAAVRVAMTISNPADDCYVNTYINNELQSSSSTGQSSKVLTEIMTTATMLGNTSTFCNMDDSLLVLSQSLMTTIAQTTNSTVISPSQAEAAATAVSSISTKLSAPSSSPSEPQAVPLVKSQTINEITTVVTTIIDTKPMSGESSTVASIGKSLNALAPIADCEQLRKLRTLAERIIEVGSRNHVTGESDDTFTFDLIAGVSQGFDSSLGTSSLRSKSSLLSDLSVQVPQLSSGLAGNLQMLRLDSELVSRCASLGEGKELFVPSFTVSVSDRNGDPVSIDNLETPFEFNIESKQCSSDLECVYLDVESTTWKTNGCETSCQENNIVCQCTHLTEFAVLKTDQSAYTVTPTQRNAFYILAGFYSVCSLISISLIVVNITIFRKCFDRLWHNGPNVAICLLSLIRAFLAVRWTGDLQMLLDMRKKVLVLLTVTPYVLICWVLTLFCMQWGMVFFVSFKRVRILKFSDYRNLYLCLSTLATVCELALGVVAFTLENGTEIVNGAIYILASIVIGVVAFTLGCAFIIFGNLLGCALLSSKGRTATAKVMLYTSWGLGMSCIFESILWMLASAGSTMITPKLSLLLSYGIMLIPIGISIYLMTQKTRKNLLESMYKRGSRKRTTRSSRSQSRTGTNTRAKSTRVSHAYRQSIFSSQASTQTPSNWTQKPSNFANYFRSLLGRKVSETGRPVAHSVSLTGRPVAHSVSLDAKLGPKPRVVLNASEGTTLASQVINTPSVAQPRYSDLRTVGNEKKGLIVPHHHRVSTRLTLLGQRLTLSTNGNGERVRPQSSLEDDNGRGGEVQGSLESERFQSLMKPHCSRDNSLTQRNWRGIAEPIQGVKRECSIDPDASADTSGSRSSRDGNPLGGCGS
ncbi:hypothetical protein AAMO2058_000478900 [Amorphochlora amoebiformis]